MGLQVFPAMQGFDLLLNTYFRFTFDPGFDLDLMYLAVQRSLYLTTHVLISVNPELKLTMFRTTLARIFNCF